MSKEVILITEEEREFEDELHKVKCKLCILVFGCAIVDKYKEEIDGIINTWGTNCDELEVPYFIFVGKNIDEYKDNKHIVSLESKGVIDDYISASFKQYLGIQWILSKYDPEFLYIAGSDIYVNVKEMINVVNKYDSNVSLFIGNGIYMCRIFEYNFQIHCGGAGFILSNKTIETIKPHLYKFQERWLRLVTPIPCYSMYIPACDVSMSLLCYLKGIGLTFERRMFEYKDPNNFNNYVSLHQMKKEDMLNIYNKK